ncbi:hypothetical protein EGW08_019986 [Elysia chlorotica]|uniref:Uncharacterized protein n=1 Tax=Elysia chlorotica TaxID=188477 RepID=A0A3S1AU94_ELYCH|nr:hypothetical protein EGW08_019986 [Elysia chlorotica]
MADEDLARPTTSRQNEETIASLLNNAKTLNIDKMAPTEDLHNVLMDFFSTPDPDSDDDEDQPSSPSQPSSSQFGLTEDGGDSTTDYGSDEDDYVPVQAPDQFLVAAPSATEIPTEPLTDIPSCGCHTKFSCDWCFGLVKRKFKRTRVDCLADMEMVVTQSAKGQLPPLVKPDGLSLQRQWYLHDEIRQFVSPEWQDIVAPLPNSPKPRGTTQLEVEEVDPEVPAPKIMRITEDSPTRDRTRTEFFDRTDNTDREGKRKGEGKGKGKKTVNTLISF